MTDGKHRKNKRIVMETAGRQVSRIGCRIFMAIRPVNRFFCFFKSKILRERSFKSPTQYPNSVPMDYCISRRVDQQPVDPMVQDLNLSQNMEQNNDTMEKMMQRDSFACLFPNRRTTTSPSTTLYLHNGIKNHHHFHPIPQMMINGSQNIISPN